MDGHGGTPDDGTGAPGPGHVALPIEQSLGGIDEPRPGKDLRVHVDYWFDPACPFSWMTSRWVIQVAPARDLRVDWRPLSLLLKTDPAPDDEMRDRMERTHAMLRVVQSLREAGEADRMGDLYTELGRRVHHQDDDRFDVAPVLEGLGLSAAHAGALDDTDHDAALRRSVDDALELVGDEVGTPIIGIDGPAGRVGLFGPVITQLPDLDRSVALWDGFVAMASTPGFYETSRTRQETPDTDTIPHEVLRPRA